MPRSPNTVTVLEDTSWERLWSGQLSKVLVLLPPWLTLGLTATAGWFTHHMWSQMPAVPWAVIGMTLAALGLTVLTWLISHARGLIGRVHATGTMLAAGMWVTAATITGPGSPGPEYLVLVGGGATALSWNIRHVIRHHAWDGDTSPEGRLSAWFKQASEASGLPGSKLRVKAISPTKAEAKMELPPGEKTAKDVQARVPYVESGMQFPPGSIIATPHPDRADWADVTITDPRAMRKPIPWPGPSAPGASIGAPIRPGMWQDGDPVAYVITGHHLQIMGMTGAGKSIGGCWNFLAEVITRPDAVVLAADITKGEQTLGPLRPALHRFETTKDGVRDMLTGLHAVIKPRTAYLSTKGLQKWQPGCGLSYLVVWLEEAPDIVDALGDKGEDRFLSTLKAIRSAGGTVVLSLQRSDWTQIPTLARSQLAKMCFGVAEAADAKFGLSDAQLDAGAAPELWQAKQPGMAYLDAPSIPDNRTALPLRTFAWGEDGQAITEHAARYPASARPADIVTATLAGSGGAVLPVTAAAGTGDGGQDDDGEPDVLTEYVTTEDPSPEIQAGIDDPIEPEPSDGPFEFETAAKMSPQDARAEFARQLGTWQAEGRAEFAPRDLRPLMGRTGMGRGWIQARLKEEAEADYGRIERDGDGTYRLKAGVTA
jgi:hypothetical protein